MRLHQLMLPSAALLASACTTVPMEVARPEPVQIVLRVTERVPCNLGAECPREAESVERRGPLVFIDGDSLVMTDMKLGHRVAFHPGPGVQLEVYRGQKRSAEAVAKGAGKGLLAGILVGAVEGLVAGGLSKVVGADVDVGESIKGGIVGGGSMGVLAGIVQGYAEGDAVWETVTLLQLRQQLCRCSDPDRDKRPEPTPWPKGPIP